MDWRTNRHRRRNEADRWWAAPTVHRAARVRPPAATASSSQCGTSEPSTLHHDSIGLVAGQPESFGHPTGHGAPGFACFEPLADRRLDLLGGGGLRAFNLIR